jgi:hypothetical protein
MLTTILTFIGNHPFITLFVMAVFFNGVTNIIRVCQNKPTKDMFGDDE